MSAKILSERLHGGAGLRIVLNSPKGNVLDIGMMDTVAGILGSEGGGVDLKFILLEGAGEHFSYGASIEDHLPDRVRSMLTSFHTVIRLLAGLHRVLIAIVRGQCLGGGMELACFCHRVFAAPDARLGQPEINLGVFAPVASLILARRAGQAVADDICLTGRTLTAREALETGLVDEVAADPRRAADDWIARQILPKSASSLAHAVRASRLRWNRAILKDLDEVERIYLDDLMRTEDAREGIEAFLAKRPPAWKNR